MGRMLLKELSGGIRCAGERAGSRHRWLLREFPSTAEDALAGEFLSTLVKHLQRFYPPPHPPTGEIKTAGSSVWYCSEVRDPPLQVSQLEQCGQRVRGVDLDRSLVF